MLILGNTSCCRAGHTPRPAGPKWGRNALSESTVWKPSPETKHLLGDVITKRGKYPETDDNYDFRCLGEMIMIEKELNVEMVCRGTGSCPEVVLREMRSMRTLTKLVSSKYNKCFKKALTVVNPAEKQSGDTAASSRLELSGNWAPGQLPSLCRDVQGRNL